MGDEGEPVEHAPFPECMFWASWPYQEGGSCFCPNPHGESLKSVLLLLRQALKNPSLHPFLFPSRSELYPGTLVSQLKSWRTFTWCSR